MASIRPYPYRKGWWRAQVRRRGIVDSEIFDSKQKAAAWAGRREAEIIEGERGAIPNLTLADLFSRYAKEVSPGKKGAKWEITRLNLLGRDRIAQVRLRDLAAPHLADWQKRRLEAVSGASVRRERNLLNNALEIARKEWGWIKVNPFERVRRPKDGQPKERVATDEEIERICEFSSQAIRVVIHFALETGMRASEIASLTPASIRGDHIVLEDTKNGTRREVPLSDKAIEILGCVVTGATDKSSDLRSGSGVASDSRKNHDFNAPQNLFGLTAGSISSLFARHAKEAGIEGLTFHCLRRTAATRLAKKLTVWELCSMFGWKDPKIPMRHYYAPDVSEIARKL